MGKEIWIKIGLPGADPQLGTLQGRVCQESFREFDFEDDLLGNLDQALTGRVPFKLFDPIIFRAQRDQQGNVLLGALNLSESMPTIEGKFLNMNPANMLWWAQIEETENWKNVVASAIHHIEIASGGDVPDLEVPKAGPRLVR